MTTDKMTSRVVEDGESSESDSVSDHEEKIEKGKVKKKLATVMNKLLQSHNEEGGQIILSKSKIKRENEEDSKKDITHAEKRLKKELWDSMSKSCPDTKLDYEKERRLRIIATQGVVQLFSTIEKHKHQVKESLSDRRTEHEKSKAYSEVGKDSFMKLLEKQGSIGNETDPDMQIKKEFKAEGGNKSLKSGWNVLAKNFYEESNMSNWDKNDSDEG